MVKSEEKKTLAKGKKQRNYSRNEAKTIKNNNFTRINREKSNNAIATLKNCLIR